VKRAILVLATALLAVSAIAQPAAPLTADAVFGDLIAKNPLNPPPVDLTVLYLASRANVIVPISTKADFIASANDTRTDVQLGATPNSAASTTLVEKPAAADILSLALERGAVTSSSDGTALTLSTTPYLLGGFIGIRDSPQNWCDYAMLRHVALAATFANAADVEQKGEFSSINSGEIKWTILGNRSPRDIALLKEFQPLLTPGTQADIAKSTACKAVTAFPKFNAMLVALATAPKPMTAASAVTALDAAAGPMTFTDEQAAQLGSCAASVAAAQNAFNSIAVQMGALTAAYLGLNVKHQLSLAGAAHRDATIDDYTTVKLLYGNNAAPKLSLNFNGEINFNQHATHKKLHSVRSFALEAGSTIGRFNEGRFDATLSGKLWRNNDTKNKNAGVFQLKGNLYLNSAMALPVSITFANQQIETIQKGWQINLGVASLLDGYLTQSFRNSP
jgi:hypothetical protein